MEERGKLVVNKMMDSTSFVRLRLLIDEAREEGLTEGGWYICSRT